MRTVLGFGFVRREDEVEVHVVGCGEIGMKRFVNEAGRGEVEIIEHSLDDFVRAGGLDDHIWRELMDVTTHGIGGPARLRAVIAEPFVGIAEEPVGLLHPDELGRFALACPVRMKAERQLVIGPPHAYEDVLTPAALEALEALAGFNHERQRIMRGRIERRAARAHHGRRIEFLDGAVILPRTGLAVQEARDGQFDGSPIPDERVDVASIRAAPSSVGHPPAAPRCARGARKSGEVPITPCLVDERELPEKVVGTLGVTHSQRIETMIRDLRPEFAARREAHDPHERPGARRPVRARD